MITFFDYFENLLFLSSLKYNSSRILGQMVFKNPIQFGIHFHRYQKSRNYAYRLCRRLIPIFDQVDFWNANWLLIWISLTSSSALSRRRPRRLLQFPRIWIPTYQYAFNHINSSTVLYVASCSCTYVRIKITIAEYSKKLKFTFVGYLCSQVSSWVLRKRFSYLIRILLT